MVEWLERNFNICINVAEVQEDSRWPCIVSLLMVEVV